MCWVCCVVQVSPSNLRFPCYTRSHQLLVPHRCVRVSLSFAGVCFWCSQHAPHVVTSLKFHQSYKFTDNAVGAHCPHQQKNLGLFHQSRPTCPSCTKHCSHPTGLWYRRGCFECVGCRHPTQRHSRFAQPPTAEFHASKESFIRVQGCCLTSRVSHSFSARCNKCIWLAVVCQVHVDKQRSKARLDLHLRCPWSPWFSFNRP